VPSILGAQIKFFHFILQIRVLAFEEHLDLIHSIHKFLHFFGKPFRDLGLIKESSTCSLVATLRNLGEYQGGVFRKQRTVFVLQNYLKLRFQNEYNKVEIALRACRVIWSEITLTCA
jgi:hypothetical protein